MADPDDYDSLSSSVEDEYDDRKDNNHRHKTDKRKRKKSSSRRRSRSSDRIRRNRDKDSKDDRKRSSSNKRCRRHDDDDSLNNSSNSSDTFASSHDDNNEDGSRHRSDKNREKKHKKRRKESSSRKHKKDHHKKKRHKSRHGKKEKDVDFEDTNQARKDTDDDDNGGKKKSNSVINTRNKAILSALSNLFIDHPLFAEELPVMLIRLAGGTTFDFRQMNNWQAATALESVLKTLEAFGVKLRPEDNMWMFQSSRSQLSTTKNDPLFLLRIIRALMDDSGITMEAINEYENNKHKKPKAENEASVSQKQQSEENGMEALKDTTNNDDNSNDIQHQEIKVKTSQVVIEFAKEDESLGLQLADLCKQIAQGECISIDGIPDEQLKSRLEAIFIDVGLEKSEMIDSDDDDDDDDDDEKIFGYGLPENRNDDVQIKLAAVMEACRNPSTPKKRVLGPMRGPPTGYDAAAAAAQPTSDSDDEDGPLLPGAAPRRQRGATLAPDDIRALAEQREWELKATKAGISIHEGGVGGREEWMIVPGKHDFLSSIKAGQSIKSRGFQNKKDRSKDNGDAPIHPAILAEMDAIRKAHEEARGPSLIEQHRAKKQQEKEAKQADGNKKSWGWNREKDLDADRRVDKDALHMVLGGAADNLKTKFQGGFNR